MKKVIAGTFVVAAFAAGLSAQTPAPTQPMQDTKDAAKSVTVTGCLKAGEAADTFVLSDLKWADKASGPVGTSGAVTPAAPATAATRSTSSAAPAARSSAIRSGTQSK